MDWESGVEEERRSSEWPVRVKYPMHGVLHARTSHQGRLHNLSTREPIGRLAFRVSPGAARREREVSHSTPFYYSLVPLIRFLGVHGPVLAMRVNKAKSHGSGASDCSGSSCRAGRAKPSGT